jgi:hypothetical protein
MLRRVLLRSAMGMLGALMVGCGGSPTGPRPDPVAEAPAVQSITPNRGPIAGGTSVTIRGLRFAAGATVTIGGHVATDVTVQGTDLIAARTPAGAVQGAADVVVTVAGRSGRLAAGFTYELPPANAPPVIGSIAAQGSRPGQPANFADVGQSIAVSAMVTDAETPSDQLEYHWSATLGTLTGSGRSVTWQAPAIASTPITVTITLRVVERYGVDGIFQHEVTGTRAVSLHDSAREVGEMARRFLDEFSKPQTNKDWQDIMRDFSAARCPDPREVESEREDVIRHYTYFFMHSYTIGSASVSFNFGARCPFRNRPGDACVAVPVFWDSTDNRTNVRGQTSGTDYIAAAYSTAESRWWLCSSDYDATGNQVHTFYSR